MYVDAQYVFASAKCAIHLFSTPLDCFHHNNLKQCDCMHVCYLKSSDSTT